MALRITSQEEKIHSQKGPGVRTQGRGVCTTVCMLVGDGDPTCVLYNLQEGVSLHGCLSRGLHLYPPLLLGLASVRSGTTHHLLSFQER